MAGATHKIENSGMFASEVEIMDLWDAGADLDEIVRRTGKKLEYVRVIVRRFNVGGSQPFDKMVTLGSAKLLAAIQRVHPEAR